MASVISRRVALAALGGSLALLGAPPARAADKLRVGKSVSEVYGYVPLDIGMDKGIFEKHGLEIEEINFAGGTKMAQAVVAGALDISLSAGPEMALIAKGAPEIAIAAIADSPAFMGISVGSQFAGSGIDSLKGKKIGVTTSGSLTDWLVAKLNQAKGWTGDDRAVAVAVGGSPTAAFAALKIGQIDADVGGTSTGYQLEALQAGRLLIDCSEYVDTIELFTIFASNAVIGQNAGAVRRFLKAWFESVDYMKSHKAESVPIAAKVTGYTEGVAERMYDTLMTKFSTDGKFRPQAIDALRASFAEFKTLPEPIDMSKLYTEQFLPQA
ncbi:MAG TPA: ABC transporter substrate-binding protein [Stellaceae bacterium]|nr:ABC transporter substrate-binding protein [Stellaceae bacterium]